MKFVSKNQNYRVVLKPGISREPITGREAVPGIYVKFEGGQAEVRDDQHIEMLKKHRSYGIDFVAIEEDSQDPFAENRRDTEPEHDLVNIDYGHPGKNLNPKPPIKMKPEQKKILADMAQKMAIEMAKEIAPKLAAEIIAQQQSSNKAEKPAEKASDSVEGGDVDRSDIEIAKPITAPDTGAGGDVNVPSSEGLGLSPEELIKAPEPIEDDSVNPVVTGEEQKAPEQVEKVKVKSGGVEVVDPNETSSPKTTGNKKK